MTRVVGVRALAVAGAFALFAAAGVAMAEDTPATQPAPEQGATAPAQPVVRTGQEPADAQDEVVCKKEEATTGTRLGAKKICKTRREWDQLARDSQEALRHSQDASGRSNPTSGSGN